MTKLLDDPITFSAIDLDQPIELSRGLTPIACAYCWEPIPAASFAFWSRTNDLLSAECPCCDRRMSLTAATWRHWSGLADELLRS
jgi:hypothetical protein